MKSMKNELAVILILFGVLVFSGCTGNNENSQNTQSNPDDLIGNWGPIEGESYSGLPVVAEEDAGDISFNSDKTGLMGGYTTTWELSGTTLTVYLYDGAESIIYEYSYDDTTSRLTLIDPEGNTYVFKVRKQ